MIFNSRPTQNLQDLQFRNDTIEWVEEFKYLGLVITNKLNFSKHINRVSLYVSRLTGIFVNIRSIVPVQTMLKLYYALVYPHLIGHIVIWGSAPTSHIRNLSVRLNNMFRVILGVRWVDGRPTINTNTMYNSNNLLKIESIFKMNLFKLLRQLLDGHLPDMYNYLLQPHQSLRNYDTRNGLFRHPALVCEVERRFLPHNLISMYDNIPAEFIAQNINIASKNFKTFLLNSQ